MGKKQDARGDEEMMPGGGKERKWLGFVWDGVRVAVPCDLCGDCDGDQRCVRLIFSVALQHIVPFPYRKPAVRQGKRSDKGPQEGGERVR